MGTYFPAHIESAARALALAGYSSEKAVKIIEAQYPDEPGLPAAKTLRDWRRDSPAIAEEEQAAMLEAHREIVLTAQRMALTDLDNHPEKYNAVQLMTVAGIAHDKLFKAADLHRPPPDNRQLVIVIPGLQPIMIQDDTETFDAEPALPSGTLHIDTSEGTTTTEA